MKNNNLLTLAALSLLAVGDVSAHYIFHQLSIGSTQYPVYQYIRENSNYNSPVTDLTSTDLRCNVGATGASTDTIAVNAGDAFTFTLDTPVYHQGPISIYMSKAPGTAADYDGSGAWFKILDIGPTFSGGSATWDMAGSYTYNIPKCIPNGEYLLRIQSLAIHNPWYSTGKSHSPCLLEQQADQSKKFYTECAQISVSGGGTAVPSPTALIPGAFKDTDPGYTVNIYSNFNNYTVPGPAVWSCGSQTGGSGGGSTTPPVVSSSSSTKPASPTTSTTTAKPATTSTTTAKPTTLSTSTTKPATTTTAASGGGGSSGCSVAKYAQCGGTGFTGCTSCASGSTCQKSNDYYSQCL